MKKKTNNFSSRINKISSKGKKHKQAIIRVFISKTGWGKKSMESSKREKGCCLLNPIPAKTSFAGENERYISGVMQSF